MNDKAGTTDWRQLREFAGVDLARSYVLSWHIESGALLIDVDLFLTPEHPFFEAPRPAEKACIRPAIVEFPSCEALATNGGSGTELVEIAGKLGNGAIRGMRRLAEGRYEITGEFGTVSIDAERPLLKLQGP